MPQSADKILDHELLFREPEYQKLFEDKKAFEYNHAEVRIEEVRNWTKTPEYQEKNFAREALTVISRRRVAGAERLVAEGVDLIIMDDGFQSARLKVDFALIVIDTVRGIGNGCTVPAGPVRAPTFRSVPLTDWEKLSRSSARMRSRLSSSMVASAMDNITRASVPRRFQALRVARPSRAASRRDRPALRSCCHHGAVGLWRSIQQAAMRWPARRSRCSAVLVRACWAAGTWARASR